jgi:uncharacterized protein
MIYNTTATQLKLLKRYKILMALTLLVTMCFISYGHFVDSVVPNKQHQEIIPMTNHVEKSAFIIHGAYGNPQENWFPWLAMELEYQGFNVYAPKFPTPEKQSLEEWYAVLKSYSSHVNEQTIMIGHSLGPSFILTVLERINTPIKSCFFVAPFIGLLNNPDFDKINKTFVEKDFDWEKINSNCKKFNLYSSDDDPYVPLEKGKFLSAKLNTELNIVSHAGHFNKSSGYLSFPKLLHDISLESMN